jgi:hypothetical protein
MPRGPKGEKRHANPIDNAMLIGRIATGEVEDRQNESKDATAVNSRRLGGLKGGKARAESLSPGKRSSIAKKAAAARWRHPVVRQFEIWTI